MSATGSAPARPAPVDAGSRGEAARAALLVLGREVLGPYLVYLALHRLAGLDNLAALVGAALVSAGLVLLGVLRSRRIRPFAAITLLMLLAGMGITLWTGDARLALARDSVISAALALVLLGSLVRRPLMFSLMWSLRPDAGDLAERWRTLPAAARARMRFVTAVWGVAMLADVAVRLVLIWTLPIDVSTAATTAVTLVMVAVLLVWMRWYLIRHAAR